MLQFRYFQLRNCGLIAYVVLCYGGEADQYRIGNCVLQHGGSGKTEQHRTGDHPFRPKAGPANLPASESRAKQPSTVQVPRKSGSANV